MGAPIILKPREHHQTITYEGTGKGQKLGNFLPFTDLKTFENSLLFDDEAELFYPRDNMLRVSESTWSENSFMRVIENTGSNFTELENQTITGQSSGASILIEKVTKNGHEVAT